MDTKGDTLLPGRVHHYAVLGATVSAMGSSDDLDTSDLPLRCSDECGRGRESSPLLHQSADGQMNGALLTETLTRIY